MSKMSYDLVTRDIIGDVQGVPATFSSWDSCMSKAYCKYPVIVGIVVGSLIVLSILFCVVQCLCCGVSCAKMLCCCCRGCGRDSRSKPARHQDDYREMPPTPYGGYQPSPAQMAWANAGNQGPQTATFETGGKKINEDSLPAMPSWDTAKTHRVEDTSLPEPKHTDDLEMGHMAPQQTEYTSRSGYNQVPPGPTSPVSPSHSQQGYFNQPTHSYNSDIGAQRMGQSTSYDNFEHAPLSPAPTYRTNPATIAPAGDRFVAGAASPSPYGYQNKPAAMPLYAPSTNASTRYEQTDYNSIYPRPHVSPPIMSGGQAPAHGHAGYDHAYDNGYDNVYAHHETGYDNGYSATSPRDQRPPSLLQVGRKAVSGSTREV